MSSYKKLKSGLLRPSTDPLRTKIPVDWGCWPPLFSCCLQSWSPQLQTSPSWTSHSSSYIKTSQKVHWGICPSAPFHYVSSKRSCLHQMLRCVAFLILPGTLIAREPLLKKTRGKEKSDPSTMTALLHILPLSFITYQLIGCHSIPTLRGRRLDQCCQSGGPSETSHWLLPQRLRRPGGTGSPWRGLEAQLGTARSRWGRICVSRASLTVAGPWRTSFPVAESFIGLSSFSLTALRVHEC